MHVVVDRKLVESCAKRDGLGDIKVSMHRFSGGAAINQALLADNVDFGAGGIGPLLIIWDKTKGNLNIRAMSNIAAMPMKLNTIDANVQKLEDYLDVEDHKIALPSVKVSGQARTLQMAAAKVWGQDNFEKLDHVTVSMKHPSAAAALLAGGQTVKSHFATLPDLVQGAQERQFPHPAHLLRRVRRAPHHRVHVQPGAVEEGQPQAL